MNHMDHEMNDKKEHCPHCVVKQDKWYKEKVFIVSGIALVLLVISYFIAFLNPFFDAFMDYLRLIWWAVLLGLLLGGIIDYFVPKEYIEKYLGQHKKSAIFYAVFFGFLMTACSHGILAIAMELYKKGANTSSVVAFLLAAPWANFSLTILFFSFFGAKAVFIILSAIVIAIITGFIYQILERKNIVESHVKLKAVDYDFSILKDIRRRIRYSTVTFSDIVKGVLEGSWTLAKMVLWWIIIGIVLASLAGAFVPPNFFMDYMSATFWGMVVVLVLATIIEVCSEGSSPMAFEIFRQTGAFGNSFVFLMAGVATDYTEIGLIWSNIGKKAAIWLPIITVPQILLLGWLFNMLL